MVLHLLPGEVSLEFVGDASRPNVDSLTSHGRRVLRQDGAALLVSHIAPS